jgi:hypothetical protein
MSFEYVETFGATIRQFLRELFGSRLTERLELDLMNLRNDMDRQLHDKDVQIASLREEKQALQSKMLTYELVVMPRASREGAEYVKAQKPVKPAFSLMDLPPTKSRWQVLQDEHEAQMVKEISEEKAATATAAKE